MGKYEAVELRDNDSARYGGQGVLKAVANINGEIKNALISRKHDQIGLDEKLIKLDGTGNKNRLGANAMLAVSLAFGKAAARASGMPLYQYFADLAGTKPPLKMPTPMFNILNGGRHAPDTLDIQEFIIIPTGVSRTPEAVRCGVEIFDALKLILDKEKLSPTLGDEGGFAVSLPTNENALEFLAQAIEKAGYQSGADVSLGIDAASSEFFNAGEKGSGRYELTRENKSLGQEEMIELYANWTKKFPLISIEDGLAEDEWDGWTKLTARLGGKANIIGDDLFATNLSRVEKGIKQNAANAAIIKPNQAGTVSEAVAAALCAKKAGWKIIVSHRSGETEDSFIADLAVGLSADYLKAGAPNRGERVAKYNRLMRIEENLTQSKRHPA